MSQLSKLILNCFIHVSFRCVLYTCPGCFYMFLILKLVHEFLDIALFVPHLLTVHHDPSLFPSVNYQANDPTRIPQKGALEQHLLGLEHIVFPADPEATCERI